MLFDRNNNGLQKIIKILSNNWKVKERCLKYLFIQIHVFNAYNYVFEM